MAVHEEVGEEQRAAQDADNRIDSGQPTGSPAAVTESVDRGHVGYGKIAEAVNDGGSARLAALAGVAEELEDDSGEERIGGAAW